MPHPSNRRLVVQNLPILALCWMLPGFIEARAGAPTSGQEPPIRLDTLAIPVANPIETTTEQQTRRAIVAQLDAATAAGKRGDFASVRAILREVVRTADAPVHYRSYAHLRLAQSYAAEGNPTGAIAEYARLAAEPAYPEHQRSEAAELRAELEKKLHVRRSSIPDRGRTTIPAFDTFAIELFVGPTGRDANPGTRAQPFATLEKARDVLRARRAAGLASGPVAVRLLPGVYPRSASFELTASDSGSAEAPIVYRADSPGTAVLYGGRRLTGFTPVGDPALQARLPAEARDRVVQLDLLAQGLPPPPPLQERGFGRLPPKATFELFWNGEPLTLARWPNDGFIDGGPVSEPGSADRTVPSVFTYLDDRHARWTAAHDGWLYGYFANGWADGSLKILRIDPNDHTVICGPYVLPERTMQPVAWFNEGRIRYFAFNLLEELDRPGEWYLDRGTGVLYLYPPSDLASAVIETGVLEAPMVVMTGASHIRFEGLIFDLSRANGLDWRDCEDCLLAGCTIRRFAADGINIRGGHGCGVYGCDLYSLGRNATSVGGGDRATLAPGRHFVENCLLHDFGRLDHTYVPGVQLSGVGNRVAHNLFYECPTTAVHISGNDHVIEYNRIDHAVMESEDQGAMELFGNATFRGVVIRYNYFSRVGPEGAKMGRAGRAAIRFDDAVSGMLVYGNIFRRASQGFGAVHMNGGRDNIIDSNLFLECDRGITGGYNPRNKWWQRVGVEPGFMISDLYLQRYPALGRIHELPGLNQAWRNLFWKCGEIFPVNPNQAPAEARFDLLANVDLGSNDPGFINAAGEDFRLRGAAAVIAESGFCAIPTEEIGIYADRYRASWPVAREPKSAMAVAERRQGDDD